MTAPAAFVSPAALAAWLLAFALLAAATWAGAQVLVLRPAQTCVLCAALERARPAPAAPEFPPAEPLHLRPSLECPGCAEAAARLAEPAALEAIVTVLVNLEPKGERSVLVAADGDVLVREQDLRLVGLGAVITETTSVKGEPFVSLRTAKDLTFRLDEARLELDLRVPLSVLGRRTVLDGTRPTGKRPQPTGAGGAFLNYNFTGNGDDRAGIRDVGMAGEVGTHVLGGLLTTDFLADRNLDTHSSRAVRLSSTLTYDDVDALRRLSLGDFVTTPGQLGGSMRLGGVSFSRRFTLDPYFLRFPGQIVTGTASVPSEVFVYSNGILVRRERVPPGTFELQNITGLAGLQTTEVVVRDVLGNEQRILQPYYYTDTVLRQGLDEYSLDAGLERRNFGVTSTDYSSLGLSAFYRRGVTDDFTFGFRGERLRDITSLGPTASARLGTAGVLGAALGASSGPAGRGTALALSHAYAANRSATGVAFRREDRAYARPGAPAASTRRELAGTFHWAITTTTTTGFAARDTAAWNGDASRQYSANVSQRIGRDLSLSLVGQRTIGTGANTELFLTLAYTFGIGGRPAAVTAQHYNFTGGSSDTVQLIGGVYDEPGLAYRMQVRNDRRGGTNDQVLNPSLQYNFDRIVTRAEYFRSSAGDNGSYQLGAAGAVASVGGRFGLSRPIFDSYGIAKVDELPGIRVYANFQEVGRTDADGIVFIPRLASYFDNPVSIEQKDLPIAYGVPQVRRTVVPALRSGVFIDFEARRVFAVKGRLLARRNDREVPFGGALGSVTVGGRHLEVFTSEDGSFYVDQVGAGAYTGSAESGEGKCEFRLVVPQSDEVVLDLGTIACNAP